MRWKLNRVFVQPNGEIELPMDAVPVGIKVFENLSGEKEIFYLTKVAVHLKNTEGNKA
jgi:hypothetical protein